MQNGTEQRIEKKKINEFVSENKSPQENYLVSRIHKNEISSSFSVI